MKVSIYMRKTDLDRARFYLQRRYKKPANTSLNNLLKLAIAEVVQKEAAKFLEEMEF